MSLSRVHRAQEFSELEAFHFASFDQAQEEQAPEAPPTETSFSETQQPETPPVAPEALSAEEAYARGKQDGLLEAGEKLDKAANALARGLEEISRLRESILRNSSQDMLRLVLTIARQVIHREVTVNPEIVLSTIEMALQASVSSDSYTIHVNPEDLELVEERKPLFLASIRGLENIHFRADAEVERGGCLVESNLGQVDATIEGQLDEVRRTLLDAIDEA
ncbi:MAG: hypothetical protein D6794_01055 [Deltaproteobacteria bacterium]|nr:MAG: hypothetical protein D6794_01055 [Deltaproteobacteria bacterium]